MGEDTPQVPMDPSAFMLTLLSMFDAEYQLWKDGIAYAQHLLGDLDYDKFSEGHLMSHFPIEVWIFSFPSLLSLYLAYHIRGDTQMW